MNSNIYSSKNKIPGNNVRLWKPWTARFEPEVSLTKFNISFVTDIKNKNQWKSQLNALKDTNKLMVVEFTAKWCGPCKSLEPKFEELAAKYTDVEFVKIDIDVLMSVWMESNLHTLPATVFMKRGQEVDRVVGVKIDELERKLHKYSQPLF